MNRAAPHAGSSKPPVLEERLSRMMLEYLLERGFEAGPGWCHR